VKTTVAAEKGLGESSVLRQRIPLGGCELSQWLNLAWRQVCSQAFAHAPWMHAVEQIVSRQTVTAPAKYVQSRASGYDQMDSIAVGVEKALQQRFPFAVFVQFVEHGDGRFRHKAI